MVLYSHRKASMSALHDFPLAGVVVVLPYRLGWLRRCSTPSVLLPGKPAIHEPENPAPCFALCRVGIEPALHGSELLHNVNSWVKASPFCGLLLRYGINIPIIQRKLDDWRRMSRLRLCAYIRIRIRIGLRPQIAATRRNSPQIAAECSFPMVRGISVCNL